MGGRGGGGNKGGGGGAAGAAAGAAETKTPTQNAIDQIYDAYLRLTGGALSENLMAGWVGFGDLRAATPNLSRDQFDEAIRRLGRGDMQYGGVSRVSNVANTKALSDRDIRSAVSFGGDPTHAITFGKRPPRGL